jgi:hypothetical protein
MTCPPAPLCETVVHIVAVCGSHRVGCRPVYLFSALIVLG